MAFTKKKHDEWRDAFVKREDFQCACGCALQLSAGDLADAIRCALPFGGKPRTWGVKYTSFPQERDARINTPEPTKTEPCPKCGDPVELPTFAADLLALRGADWPKCGDCRNPSKAPAHSAREYWE